MARKQLISISISEAALWLADETAHRQRRSRSAVIQDAIHIAYGNDTIIPPNLLDPADDDTPDAATLKLVDERPDNDTVTWIADGNPGTPTDYQPDTDTLIAPNPDDCTHPNTRRERAATGGFRRICLDCGTIILK